jgi:hypothetical protein
MTTAKTHHLPQRNAKTDNISAVRSLTADKHPFQPGAERAALTVRPTGTGGDRQSECRVTGPLLREFLALLEELQEDINSRWNGREDSGRRVQCDGSHFRES